MQCFHIKYKNWINWNLKCSSNPLQSLPCGSINGLIPQSWMYVSHGLLMCVYVYLLCEMRRWCWRLSWKSQREKHRCQTTCESLCPRNLETSAHRKKKNTKLKQKQEVCLNNAASTEKHRLAVFERKWWNGKRTHPASALWLCSLSLRPRWSFQPEHRRRRTIIESNRDISTIIDTRTRVHLGSSWLELPRPYSGMTLSLLMPALHTGHCCLLGCVSNH